MLAQGGQRSLQSSRGSSCHQEKGRRLPEPLLEPHLPMPQAGLAAPRLECSARSGFGSLPSPAFSGALLGMSRKNGCVASSPFL